MKKNKSHVISKTFWGLFFILSGLLIIINQLGYFTQINILSLVFTILLVAIIIKSIFNGFFGGIFFPLAMIGIIYAEALEITNVTPWPILITAFFLSIGFSIIFHKNYRINRFYSYNNDNHEHFDKIINEDDDSVVETHVSFGSSIKYVNSNNLKRANFSCSFGALKIYFDNTRLDENGAEIYLNASFSGVELYIPKNWTVIFSANTSLAGIDEKNRSTPDGKNTVTLIGNINLSGVEIIYI